MRRFVVSALVGLSALLAGVRTWSRGRIVAVTCIGPFLAVVLSALGCPILAVLSFGAGVVFFHAATSADAPAEPPAAPEPPTDLEA